jgi:hypothetical protein
MLAAVEVGAGVWALARPGRWSAALLAALYASFAVFLITSKLAGAEGGCGCAGAKETPPNWTHVALDLGVVALGVAVAVQAPPIQPAVRFLADQPLAGVPLIAGLAGVGIAVWVLVADLPELGAAIRDSSRIGHHHGHATHGHDRRELPLVRQTA